MCILSQADDSSPKSEAGVPQKGLAILTLLPLNQRCKTYILLWVFYTLRCLLYMANTNAKQLNFPKIKASYTCYKKWQVRLSSCQLEGMIIHVASGRDAMHVNRQYHFQQSQTHL